MTSSRDIFSSGGDLNVGSPVPLPTVRAEVTLVHVRGHTFAVLVPAGKRSLQLIVGNDRRVLATCSKGLFTGIVAVHNPPSMSVHDVVMVFLDMAPA